jgi:uncharacterized protein
VRVHVLRREQWLPQTPAAVFEFFADARNLELITPSSLRFRIVDEPDQPPHVGTLIHYRLQLRGITVRWTARIDEWEPPERFVDRQLRGPYRQWEHTHEFLPRRGGTLVRDTVRYAMRAGAIGEAIRRLYVAGELNRIFDYRVERIEEIFGGSSLSP